MAENNAGLPSSQAEQAQRQQASQPLPYDKLLKPEQIANLRINDEQKKRFGPGVAQFWNIINSKPKEDQQHREAVTKLSQLTYSLMNQAKVSAQKARQEQQSQEQQQQQQQQQQQNPRSQPMQRPPSQGQHAPNDQTSTANAIASQVQMAQPSNLNDFPEPIRIQVDQMSWIIPPNHSQPQIWKEQMKKRFAGSLWNRERAQQILQSLNNRLQQMRNQSQDIPQELIHQQQSLQSQYNTADKFIREAHTQQNNLRNAQQAQQSQQAARNASGPMINGGQNAAQQQHTSMGGAGGAPGGAAGGQNAQQQQQQQQRPVPQSAAVEAVRQQQMNRQASAATPPSATSQPPNSASLQQHAQQSQQFSRPPQPNQNSAGAFAQQSPQSGLPPNASQGTMPFTQQGAMDASRSHGNGTLPQQSVNQVTGQQFSTPSADKPNASSRWPMSKNFNPQAPTPVPMGSTRPTMAGPNNGPMGSVGQPAIQQQPSYQLYGQGGHVMDKKKLDELVRQVCGPGDGTSTQGLQPDVEEIVLELADEFFDNVVASACKLAKIRGSQVLEIRDIQLVLQRQYNIRIPGYSMDEVRTVRKVQPTAGFFQKLNVINAAKVMGPKGDL